MGVVQVDDCTWINTRVSGGFTRAAALARF
jgi:hypothetical protein